MIFLIEALYTGVVIITIVSIYVQEAQIMSWSIKLGQIFGIDIKMHLTFLLILFWGALNYGGSAGPLYGVIVTIALFTLVLLHELG